MRPEGLSTGGRRGLRTRPPSGRAESKVGAAQGVLPTAGSGPRPGAGLGAHNTLGGYWTGRLTKVSDPGLPPEEQKLPKREALQVPGSGLCLPKAAWLLPEPVPPRPSHPTEVHTLAEEPMS